MPRLRLGVLLIVTSCVLATAASAKGPREATICGETGCVTVRDPDQGNAIALSAAPFAIRAAPSPAPFFTIGLGAATLLYVPSARAIRVDGDYFLGQPNSFPPARRSDYWIGAPPVTMVALNSATAELEPYDASAEWAPSQPGRSRVWEAAVVAGAALLLVFSYAARRRWNR